MSFQDPWAKQDPWATTDPWATPPATRPTVSAPVDSTDPDYLLDLLDKQASLIVSTGTGGPAIDSVNGEYRARRRILGAALRARGLADPFPFDDLWGWYGHYSQHLPSYASRRIYVSGLAAPIRAALESARDGVALEDPGSAEDETWTKLELRLRGIMSELSTATSLDDMQDVGRRCREVLIDAAKLLAEPSLVPDGGSPPQTANAKVWLDLFLAAHASGRTHRELRAFVPVCWDLAQKVTHGDVDRVDVYAAAQATVLVVRVLQQLSGETT